MSSRANQKAGQDRNLKDRDVDVTDQLVKQKQADAKKKLAANFQKRRGITPTSTSRSQLFEGVTPGPASYTAELNEEMADLPVFYGPEEDPSGSRNPFSEGPTAEEIASFNAVPATASSRGRGSSSSNYQPPIGGYDIPSFAPSKRGRKSKSGKGEGVSTSKYSAKRVKPEVAKVVFNQNTGMMELLLPKGELNQKNALFVQWRNTLRRSPWFSDQPKHMQYIYQNNKIRTDGSVRAEFRRSRKAIMNHDSYLNARPKLKEAIEKKREEYAKYAGKSASEIQNMANAPALFVKGKRSATGNKLRHNFKAQLVKATMKARSDAALKKKMDRAYYMKTGGRGKDFPKIPKAKVPRATGSEWATRYPPNIQATYFRNL